MSSATPDEDPRMKSHESADDATRFSTLDDVDSLDFDLSDPESGKSADSLSLLGEYLPLEQIGAGGMGQVFRAEHRTMNRHVALKILNSDITDRPDLLERFFSEIRAVAKLMHPNIVTAFDAGSAGDTHYLVMELVEGEVLSSRVRQQGPLSTSEAVHILEQAAQGLRYAHQLGIVHRDIKPSNMMLTHDGTLKILDFGLAMLGKGDASESSKNTFMGTPEYMSPEQIKNADDVDGRSDLYSLGATLFYMLTGQAMFTGEPMQVAMAQLRKKPLALYAARGDVDLRLDAVFQRLVAKDPGDRYASAEELLDNLRSLNLTSQPAAGTALSKGAGRLAGDNPTSVALSRSTLAKKSQIVAIDLGMMVSTAAYFDPSHGPQIVQQGEGNAQHLRNMLWSAGDSIKIGAEAVALRRTEPEHVNHCVQRRIGARELPRPLGGKTVPPEVGLAALLRKIMWNAAAATDHSTSAIVTVPSCYDQMHRRAIRDACRIAGIDLLQLLDKTLAAALSWLDVNSRLSTLGSASSVTDSKLLVVHLGGTGLEVSVVHVRGSVAQQLGTCGHWKLGSLKWQRLLTEYFASTLSERSGKSILEDVAAATRLQRTVELAMDRLTRTSKVDVRFDWQGTSIQQTVTQAGLVKIAPELTRSLQESIHSACRIAKTDRSEIDQILLVGSMMQMKPIQEIVRKAVPHSAQVSVLEKADLARGAALQAQHLSAPLTEPDRLHPKAISCSAYDFALLAASSSSGTLKPRVLLEKSSALPAAYSRSLRPSSLGGSSSRSFSTLQLIESSSLGSSNWLRLGKVKPDEIFPNREANAPLQLRLEVDESGILESSLLWPDGNRQVRLPETSDETLSESEIASWREWLETALLCSSD